MAFTHEQSMLAYILVALRMIKIGDSRSCIDQVNKLLALAENVGVPKEMAKKVNKHLRNIQKIIDGNLSNDEWMSPLQGELLDLEIIFNKHGIK